MMRIFSRMLNLLPNFGYGRCRCCKISWQWVDGHCTWYRSEDSGMFPLCEYCWNKLNPNERLPYYQSVFEEWKSAEISWEEIRIAVLAGK